MAKTELIKFRCTPEEKAKWEQIATHANKSLSDFIRWTMAQYEWALDPTPAVTSNYQPPVVLSQGLAENLLNVKTSDGKLIVPTKPESDLRSQANRGRVHSPRCTCLMCKPKG